MHWTLAAALLNTSVIAGPQVPAERATPAVAISTVAIRRGPVIAIDATGPLPSPRIGTLRNPDRLYFDFDGVSSRTLKIRGGDPLVSSVRAALNSVAPRITRVVIDLSQPCRYSLETSGRGSGHLEIALTPIAAGNPGSEVRASAGKPASRLAPPTSGVAPPASALRAPAAEPASRLRSSSSGGQARIAPRDAATRRYLAVVQPALAQLDVLREVLHDIDARTNPAVDRVATAQSQLSALRGTLDRVTPTRSVQGAHDLLKSVVGFASTALSLSADGSGEVSPNASSAAAGALLMLERAEAELLQRSDSSRLSL